MIRHQIRALRKILTKPVVLYSTSISSVEKRRSVEERKSAFQQLLEEFHASKHLILTLKNQDVININFKAWKSRINAMMKYGFSDLACFEMISIYPALLEIPLPKFEDTLLQWNQSKLKPEHFELTVKSQPLLLEVGADVIRKRIPQLWIYFNNSNSLASLLRSSPNIMFDNWQAVLQKINYLLKERGFKTEDLSQGDILSNSMDFIKFRLDLLEKCGIYKQNKIPVHKINKFDKSGHKNPPLKDLLVKNTKDFVKLAKITEEEYFVYEDIFMTENPNIYED